MNRFRIICTICSLLIAGSSAAVETYYRAAFRSGFILNDGKVELSAPNRIPALGGEMAVSFRPDWTSLRQWNGSALGVALSYWYMGDANKLGHAIAPYAYMDIPIVRLPHFVLGLRPGIGAAFLTKTYANTVPEGHAYQDLQNANRSIGSVSNFYFPEAFYFEVPFHTLSIHAAGGWYHMSNGSLKQPNSGYNILAGEIGLSFYPSGAHYSPLPRTEDQRFRKFELELAATFGGRDVYYRDLQKFFCSEVQLAAYWRAHNIFRLGLGADMFYDGAYVQRSTHFTKTNLSLAQASDCWRLGVSLQPEFVVGHFTAGFHFGVYLLDGVKNLEASTDEEKQTLASGQRLNKPIFYKYDLLNAGSAGYPDGWLYTQIVLRYHLPWHLFVQGAMKAHLTKVEFVSAGLGVYL